MLYAILERLTARDENRQDDRKKTGSYLSPSVEELVKKAGGSMDRVGRCAFARAIATQVSVVSARATTLLEAPYMSAEQWTQEVEDAGYGDDDRRIAATVFACLPESTEEGKLLLRNIAEHPWLARSGRMLLEYLIAEREKAHFDEQRIPTVEVVRRNPTVEG